MLFALTEASIPHVQERTHACHARGVTLRRVQVHLVERRHALSDDVLASDGPTRIGLTARVALHRGRARAMRSPSGSATG